MGALLVSAVIFIVAGKYTLAAYHNIKKGKVR